MKKLALVLAALAMALPAAAQQQPGTRDAGHTKIGLGISIIPDTLFVGSLAAPRVDLYLPIQISPQLRVEPSLGIRTIDRGTGQVDERDVALGVGVFFMQPAVGPLDLYMGGRLKLNFAHVTNPSDSGTDLVIAAAVGGEYYFVPRFSIGLEGQLGFYQNSTISGDDSGLFTNGLAFLRVYF